MQHRPISLEEKFGLFREQSWRGRRINRYLAWHPYDDVHASYVRRRPDGSIGSGARSACAKFSDQTPASTSIRSRR
jgi:hypothetical protein